MRRPIMLTLLVATALLSAAAPAQAADRPDPIQCNGSMSPDGLPVVVCSETVTVTPTAPPKPPPSIAEPVPPPSRAPSAPRQGPPPGEHGSHRGGGGAAPDGPSPSAPPSTTPDCHAEGQRLESACTMRMVAVCTGIHLGLEETAIGDPAALACEMAYESICRSFADDPCGEDSWTLWVGWKPTGAKGPVIPVWGTSREP